MSGSRVEAAPLNRTYALQFSTGPTTPYCDLSLRLSVSQHLSLHLECSLYYSKETFLLTCTVPLKKKRDLEQSYGLCERGRGWEDLGKWH